MRHIRPDLCRSDSAVALISDVVVLEVRTERKLDGSADSRILTSMYAFFQ
jgi:hypothetical protein